MLGSNTRHPQLKGRKVYFGSQFIEVSAHRWLGSRQSGMVEGHDKRIFLLA